MHDEQSTAEPDISVPASLLGDRFCMDWSERRPHLAGAVGAALLDWMLGRRLLTRIDASRALVVHPGAQRFALGLEPPP